MLRIVTISFVLLLNCSVYAQDEEVFKVVQPKDIRLIPDMDTLLDGKTYYFGIMGITTLDIERARFQGRRPLTFSNATSLRLEPRLSRDGRLSQTDTLFFELTQSAGGKVVIAKVFTITQNPSLIYSTPSWFRTPPQSDPTTRQVWWLAEKPLRINDTATYEQIKQSPPVLRVRSNNTRIGTGDYVNSFAMEITSGDKTEKFQCYSDEFNGAIIKRLMTLKSDFKVTISDLKYIERKTSAQGTMPTLTLYIKQN